VRSGDHTTRRCRGWPAWASPAAVPERLCPPQPTSEKGKQATPPPFPRANRDASDPLWQRHGKGEGGNDEDGLGFGGGARVARARATGCPEAKDDESQVARSVTKRIGRRLRNYPHIVPSGPMILPAYFIKRPDPL
jgi:hypothetical protein